MPVVGSLAARPIADSAATDRAPGYWAALTAEAVVAELVGSTDGLSETEAAARLTRFGPNRLPEPPRTPCYLELAANFIHFFAILLWIGAALAWLAGSPQV